MIMVASK